jgi:hypothetical protein
MALSERRGSLDRRTPKDKSEAALQVPILLVLTTRSCNLLSSPREAIYVEGARIVLCNPIGFYDGVGGVGRGKGSTAVN